MARENLPASNKEEPTFTCPICLQVDIPYNHVYNEHKDFWDINIITETYPKTAEEFNQRFKPLGLYL